MTDAITSQNIDLSSWIILYKQTKSEDVSNAKDACRRQSRIIFQEHMRDFTLIELLRKIQVFLEVKPPQLTVNDVSEEQSTCEILPL
jgi:hypothetical protein